MDGWIWNGCIYVWQECIDRSHLQIGDRIKPSLLTKYMKDLCMHVGIYRH